MKNQNKNRGGEAGPKTGPLPSLHPLSGSVEYVVRRLRVAGDTEAAEMIEWLCKSREGFARRLAEVNVLTSPEGCTATDARQLRKINHELGDENDQMKDRAIAAESALERLLNTSAVVSSDEDFVEITCVNRHYEAAYDVLRDISPNAEDTREAKQTLKTKE